MGDRKRRGFLAIAIVLGSALPANAFYWRGWPASVRIPDRPLTNPDDNPPEGPTPILPPPDVIFPPPVPIGPPVQTPEPATGLIALFGLGAVAAVRKWKK